jgi:methylmalonyl-CoA/ethylmalonyl-CoA epimerase
MILRIDPVAIAVRDYDRAFDFFTRLFGAVPGASAEDPGLKYRWQLMCLGDLSRIELLRSTGRGSFLEGFLEHREGGVHHITLQTRNLEKAAASLRDRGIPYFGYHEYGYAWKELFIHPRDAFGVLIQIAEFNPDDWLPAAVKGTDHKKFEVHAEDDGCSIWFAHPGGGRAKIRLTGEEMKDLHDELNGLCEKG